MATNERCGIDQGNTFGLLVLVMCLHSARGIADHHGVSSIQCNVYDDRSIEYVMAQPFYQPNHAQYGCSSPAGSHDT